MKPECQSTTKTVQCHLVSEWTEVSREKQYTPSNADIGHALKMECIPRNGEQSGFIKEIIAKHVIDAGPGFCPFENRHAFTSNYVDDERWVECICNIYLS